MRSSYALLSLLIISVLLTYTLGCVYAYFYPMKYSENIENCSSKYNIESALVASVINVESGFNENATSAKGAIGLMQLMPATAEWIAEKMNLEFQEIKLYEPEYNMEIGTYYLSYLINYFDDVELGLCAYNAGQGNVKNWLENSEYSEDGKTLNKVPFSERKNYINKVYKNYHYYKNKYK